MRLHQAGTQMNTVKMHVTKTEQTIEAQMQVIETENSNLATAEKSIHEAETVLMAELDECEMERTESIQLLKKYQQEVEELESIASPEVRAEIQEGEGGAGGGSSLLQTVSSFGGWAHRLHSPADASEKKEDRGTISTAA